MDVATQVGTLFAGLGVDTVFGVVGSGNFHVTNALVAAGARTRLEGQGSFAATQQANPTGRAASTS